MILESQIFQFNLKLLRTNKEMSGEDLAAALKFESRKRILDLENGRMPPRFDELVTIGKYFDINIGNLIGFAITLNYIPYNLNHKQ